MMRPLLAATVIAVLVWGSSPSVHGQKATEMYIPLGQSPGASGKETVIGKIEGLDPQNRTVTIAGSSGKHTVTITNRTKIWLDRSTLKLRNQRGKFSDLQVGRTVEIKYEDPKQKGKGTAEWIKVQLTG